MKLSSLFFISVTLSSSAVFATSTADIGSVRYTFDPMEIFPTTRPQIPTDKGVDNIIDYLLGMVPVFTTFMAIAATLMIILGGFYMVMGGANSEQTEKGKGIIKDALVGIIVGLLAYVIIVTL